MDGTNKPITQRWWFGHVVVLVMLGAPLFASALMSPNPEVLTIFGVEVPVMCNFRRMFGLGCPGCGLTRSWVYLAHGAPLDAFKMNPLGPFFFAFAVWQVGYRVMRLWQGPRPLPSR